MVEKRKWKPRLIQQVLLENDVDPENFSDNNIYFSQNEEDIDKSKTSIDLLLATQV